MFGGRFRCNGWMEVLAALTQLGGAARRQQLLDVGVPRRQIDGAVAAGLIRRPLRGCLTLPDTSMGHALACYFNGRLTCTSAALWHGIRVLRKPQVPHLEVDAGRAGHRNASMPHRLVRMHRSRTHRAGSLAVSVARAIDVAGDCVTPLAQLVMVDHALASARLAPQQIDSFTVTPPPVRRWLAKQADHKAGSVSETCARVALAAAGLHLETQSPFGDGRYADFLVNGCLYVEIDGYTFHSDRRQFAEDRARDRYLMGLGYRVMRFTYENAVRDPEQLVADVLRALSVSVKTPERLPPSFKHISLRGWA